MRCCHLPTAIAKQSSRSETQTAFPIPVIRSWHFSTIKLAYAVRKQADRFRLDLKANRLSQRPASLCLAIDVRQVEKLGLAPFL
jgi:hypothetical protein